MNSSVAIAPREDTIRVPEFVRVSNRAVGYPSEVTGVATEYLQSFKRIYDSVHVARDLKIEQNSVLWLNDENFVKYHLYKMATYGDVFLDKKERHEDIVCWKSAQIIANTSHMVKVAGATYNRKAYPGIFVEEEIRNRLRYGNRRLDIMELDNAEVLQMLVNNKLDLLLHGSPKKNAQNLVRPLDEFAFKYRARVATLQAAGLFDKILDEARPQDEWIHQFVWPI